MNTDNFIICMYNEVIIFIIHTDKYTINYTYIYTLTTYEFQVTYTSC